MAHLLNLGEPDIAIALSFWGRLCAAAASVGESCAASGWSGNSNGRGARSPGALYRVSGTEGVCGLLAVGYHYL